MTLTTPTTKEISDNLIAQLEVSLNQTIPLLPKSFLRVLAKSISGVFILLYKYNGFMFQQQFVRLASINPTTINGIEIQPLLEWGRLIGVLDPIPATNAELLIRITVKNQTGSLPSNTQLLGSQNGVTYMTLGAVLLDASTIDVIVRAVSDQSGGGGAGAIGNLDAGATLSFANPIANVSRNTVVLSQSVAGADAETNESYRQRVIDRFQKRPQGGALADYQGWSKEVAGIVNAYPYTSEFPGQVDVYIEATAESSGSEDGIPTNAQLLAVRDNIDYDQNGLASRRPANALVNTFAISRSSFTIRVLGLTVENEAQVQSNITLALEEYFLQREPFIDGLSQFPRKDRITLSGITGVVDGIVSASGGIFSLVLLYKDSVGIDNYFLGIGEKAKVSLVEFE